MSFFVPSNKLRYVHNGSSMNDSGEDMESDVVRLKLLLLLRRMHMDRRFGWMDEDSLSLFLAPVVGGAAAVREKSKSPSTFGEVASFGFLDIADGGDVVIGLFNCNRMRFILSVALWCRGEGGVHQSSRE
jgi:hypothetical protein